MSPTDGKPFQRIYPAHAGINLKVDDEITPILHLPRTRGDKPVAEAQAGAQSESTPHTRG